MRIVLLRDQEGWEMITQWLQHAPPTGTVASFHRATLGQNPNEKHFTSQAFVDCNHLLKTTYVIFNGIATVTKIVFKVLLGRGTDHNGQ